MCGGGAENNARPRPPPPLAPRYRRSPAGSLSSLVGASGRSPSPKYLEVGVGGGLLMRSPEAQVCPAFPQASTPAPSPRRCDHHGTHAHAPRGKLRVEGRGTRNQGKREDVGKP